ncbi:Uncharacterised protein [uncultured archaeon]|nr:Uncharacterised protein [uncultured archaeon]
MYLKIHPSPEGDVVAMCDEALLGQVLSGAGMRLDLEAYKAFYEGRKVSEGEAVLALSAARSANLVGKKSLGAAKKAGLDVSGAVLVAGVPHLQLYKV